MCQSANTPKTRNWNARISRFLIVAGFTLLAVKTAQSMPPKDFRESFEYSGIDHSAEEQEYGGPETRTIQHRPISGGKNESRDMIRGRERGPVLTKERRTGSDGDAIKYPGDWERNEPNLLPMPLPSCQGKTFCEGTATDYPQEYLSNLISKTESLRFFSGVDQIDLVQRVDSADGDGQLLCGSETQIVYPKTAQNSAKEWLFVLQDEKQEFKQGVKIENCNAGTADGACKIIEGSIYGYKTTCKQKYVSRILAAVRKNGTAVKENFSMPSSCCCQLKLIGDAIGSRSGGITPKGQTPAPIKSGRNH